MGTCACLTRHTATVTPENVGRNQRQSNAVTGRRKTQPPSKDNSMSYLVDLAATITMLSAYQRQRLKRYFKAQGRKLVVTCVIHVTYRVEASSGAARQNLSGFVIQNPRISWGLLPILEQVPRQLPSCLGSEFAEWFALLEEREAFSTNVHLRGSVQGKEVSYTSRVSQCCQCEAEADLVDKVLARMEESAEQTSIPPVHQKQKRASLRKHKGRMDSECSMKSSGTTSLESDDSCYGSAVNQPLPLPRQYRPIPFVIDMSHNEGQEDDEVFLNEEEERRLREMDSDQSQPKNNTSLPVRPKGPKRQLSERGPTSKAPAQKSDSEERVAEMPREHDIILKPLTSQGDDVIDGNLTSFSAMNLNQKPRSNLRHMRKLTPSPLQFVASKPPLRLEPLTRNMSDVTEEDEASRLQHLRDIESSLTKALGPDDQESPQSSPKTSREQIDSYLNTASEIFDKVRKVVRNPVAFTSAAIRRSMQSSRNNWMFSGQPQNTRDPKVCSNNPTEGTSGLTRVSSSSEEPANQKVVHHSGRRDTPAVVVGPERLGLQTRGRNKEKPGNSCFTEELEEEQEEAEYTPATHNNTTTSTMAATADQQQQQQQQNQQQQQTEVTHGHSPLDSLEDMSKSKDSNSLNSSKDSRGVRFVDSETREILPSRSPVAHPKNKVLKRKNTPATLPKVDKIYARDQGIDMGSFAEDNEEEEEEDVGEAVGGVVM